MMTKESVKQQMAKGDRTLAWMVYWTELADVRVLRQVFRNGMTDCGLAEALTATPKAEKVLNLAVQVANRRQSREGEARTAPGYAELKRKDDQEVTYAVLMRRDLPDRARYLEEARVTIPRGGTTPNVKVELDRGIPRDEARDHLLDTIVDQYGEILRYADTQEVSKALVAGMRDVLSGLTLKAGFYLVRPEYTDNLEKLQRFMSSSMRANLQLWEIKATTNNVQTAKVDARASLRKAIDELIVQANEFVAENTNPAETAQKSINAQMRKFRDLDAKVSLYADILGEYRSDLTKSIAKAKQSILGAYLGDADDEAA